MYLLSNKYSLIFISLIIHIIVGIFYFKDSNSNANANAKYQDRIAFDISLTSIDDKKDNPTSSIKNKTPSASARTSPKKITNSLTTASPTISEKSLLAENWSPHKRYRSTNELDTRAVPITDWNIDISQAPDEISFVLVFTVWISETGSIDLIEYPNSDDEAPWLNAVRAHLANTEMQPATLEGQPVPSTMIVEISVEPVH